jgi:uncharacterized membrane protein
MTSSGGPIPFWGISLAFWLHMVATVVWIGGLVSLVVIVLPIARKYLDNKDYSLLLDQLQRRLDPLGWLSLAVLLVTGLFQMSANPNYEGFLTFTNRWAVSILIKHILFALMIAISAYMTWWLVPSLRRIALLREKAVGTEQAEKLELREVWMLRLNLLLGLLILGLTAVARAS